MIVTYDEQYTPGIIRIRNAVFTEEQKIDKDLDFDGQDKDAFHVLVMVDDQFVATGRLLDDGHIGRIAVLKKYRCRGIGRKAILSLIEKAKQTGLKRVYLGAQINAIGFYKKLGFSEYGSRFLDAGIEHVHMEKLIR